MRYLSIYRVRDWYRNMGIAVVGVLAASPGEGAAVHVAVALLQVFLVQVHSFTMNDYYDALYWGEDNDIRAALDSGVRRRTVLLLGHLPLVGVLAGAVFTGPVTFLLAGYVVLFYVYQGPLRWKRNWALSILLNATGLGLIIFLHPYVATAPVITPSGVYLALLFTAYMAAFEVLHQMEHQDADSIFSIVDRFGTEGGRILTAVFLAVPAIAGLVLIVLEPTSWPVAVAAPVLAPLRIYDLWTCADPGSLRPRWHKLYTLPEGVYYVVVLAAPLLSAA